MTAEQYKPIYHWFSAHPTVKRLVVFLDRWLPLVPFVCYPVLLYLLNVRLSPADPPRPDPSRLLCNAGLFALYEAPV